MFPRTLLEGHRELAAIADMGFTEKGSLDLITADEVTSLKAKLSGGQRGVMWAFEVGPLPLDYSTMCHNGVVMKCN